jgi:hypothetical protein
LYQSDEPKRIAIPVDGRTITALKAVRSSGDSTTQKPQVRIFAPIGLNSEFSVAARRDARLNAERRASR